MIQAVGIAGFRSYPPNQLQKIEFQGPLTLIWGKHGSGKTVNQQLYKTIIQVMRYIMTGNLPKNSAKGINFIMNPNLIYKKNILSTSSLKLRLPNGNPIIFQHKAILTKNQSNLKLCSIQQIAISKLKGELITTNPKLLEIYQMISEGLDISQSILQNLVFSTQQSYFHTDSTALKTIFDQIFNTKNQTKLVNALKEQYRNYSREVRDKKKQMDYTKRLYNEDNKNKLYALCQLERLSQESLQIAKIREYIEMTQWQLHKCRKEFSVRQQELVMKIENLERETEGIMLNQCEEFIRQLDLIQNQFVKKEHEFQSSLSLLKNMQKKNDQKKQQISLKSQILFQEYHKESQTKYLINKIQLQAMNTLLNDLSYLSKTLDTTICNYQAHKLQQFNQLLSNIWKQTYYGQDIIRIYIRSDSLNKYGYNYIVMMEKIGGIKIQMGSHGSIGQKIIAFIVIKLALLEIIQNCGILVMDCPTAYLNVEQSVKLAYKLQKVLKQNETKPIQMILITQDLQLIKLLSMHTQHYYDVSLNKQQFSLITKRSIEELLNQH